MAGEKFCEDCGKPMSQCECDEAPDSEPAPAPGLKPAAAPAGAAPAGFQKKSPIQKWAAK